jgi:hypothetical protein
VLAILHIVLVLRALRQVHVSQIYWEASRKAKKSGFISTIQIESYFLAPSTPLDLWTTFAALYFQFKSNKWDNVHFQNIDTNIKKLKELVSLFEDISAVPKLHCLEHLLQNLIANGPATLWESSPFEAKHKEYRK